MLLYATYQPLRFAIEDPSAGAVGVGVRDRRRRVRADQLRIVRLSTAYVHPRTLSNISGNLPGRMQVVFYLALVSVALLWITLWRYEMTSKHASAQLRALKRLLGGDEEEARRGAARRRA